MKRDSRVFASGGLEMREAYLGGLAGLLLRVLLLPLAGHF